MDSVYKAIVFDCDGVILDSNKIKTQAFYKVALPYGEAAAAALVAHHTANGGVSRYKKFTYFLEFIVPVFATVPAAHTMEQLLAYYAAEVKQGLLTCAVAPALQNLRDATPNARWLIASGGDQAELREVFDARGLTPLFDGGIFGSPDTKDEILQREAQAGTLTLPALFIGDSKYDFQAAQAAGLDFVFMKGWSEVENHQAWCAEHGIPAYVNIAGLL